ncbi:hypothetical protein RintRC_3704 [Richelia intracellularis]|nr:hypothetical protein RintRC_3704 [Richelia intracellularis]
MIAVVFLNPERATSIANRCLRGFIRKNLPMKVRCNVDQ